MILVTYFYPSPDAHTSFLTGKVMTIMQQNHDPLFIQRTNNEKKTDLQRLYPIFLVNLSHA